MTDEVIVLNSEELDIFGDRWNGLAEGVDGSVYLGQGLPKRIGGFPSDIDQQMPFVAGMGAVVLDLLADQYPDPLDTLTSFAWWQMREGTDRLTGLTSIEHTDREAKQTALPPQSPGKSLEITDAQEMLMIQTQPRDSATFSGSW